MGLTHLEDGVLSMTEPIKRGCNEKSRALCERQQDFLRDKTEQISTLQLCSLDKNAALFRSV